MPADRSLRWGGVQCCCVEATYRDSAELVTVENAASSAVTLEERADFAPLVCSEGFEFTTSFANLAGLSGVGFEVADAVSVVVACIDQQAVGAWEAASSSGPVLAQHDRIVEANGVSGSAAGIISELRSEGEARLVVQRPRAIFVALRHESGAPLGLDLQFAQAGTTLLVCGVDVGAVQEWNERQASSSTRIDKFDRIVEVNGVRGPVAELMSAVSRATGSTAMVVLKYGIGPK
eukprot:CAMPEP_0176210770 /NCGR_PEP_ID=MMETSP0121_2-20121125/14312_1 /TAXON_ID=160619 /ORGANISM="Kryptoperidinium foliaceum, Strain CCMP 1326" /LENGTH=233 /DNA_ID=CAMNT_0017549807 /DNA_START=30 /DNA_END=731 /DNA_ORIENTATION=-